MSTAAEEDEEDATLAGLARGASRSLARFFNKALPGQLPLPKKAVAKGIDQLSAVVDIGMEVNKLKSDDKNEANAKRKTDSSSGCRGRGIGSRLLLVLPNFLKTTVLGTVLFEVYDEVSTYHIDPSYEGTKKMEATSGDAFVAGTTSGAIHGVLFCTWDSMALRAGQIVHKSSKLRSLLGSHTASLKLSSPVSSTSPYIIAGTTLSHSLVHGALFSSYVTLKNIIWRSLDERDRHSGSLKGTLTVAAAGAMSGMIAETVGLYTWVFEERGICRGMRSFSLSPRLIFSRQVLLASFPGCLGFLAFEFGKDVVRIEDT